jgi:formylglycine-generating enzyme required for sulfatase activity
MQRFSSYGFLVCVLLASCSKPSKNEGAASKTAEMGSVSAVDGTPKPVGETTSEADAGVGSILHFEGTARPPGIIAKEKVLPKPSFPSPSAEQMVTIPEGTLTVGSPVEDTLRVNYAEMDMAPMKINGFEMDALPYPNDPTKPFAVNITKAEAERSCAEQGKRLCTELEWEFACKSEDARRYPSGNIYDPSDYPDSDPMQPVSPFGVFAMGRILEWTSGSWGKEPDQIERGVAKGHADGFELTPIRGRRCATRWRRVPTGSDPAIGFRCCRGEVNKAEYTIEPARPPFSLYNNIKPDKFAQIIQAIPELAAIHDNPHMFSDADIRTVMARRENDREELADQGIHFRWKPIRWIPRQGMELWVAVGRSNRHSFIVALHEAKDNEVYVHASSLVLWDQPAALALGYREGHRDELYWAPCWGCRDGGTVTFDDVKNEVIITHRW